MKKRTIKILIRINVIVFLVSGGFLWFLWSLTVFDKEEKNGLFFDSDSTIIFTDPNNLFIEIPTILYEPKEHLKDLCWVRALTKLAQIYDDPNIVTASMTAGWCTYSWGGLNAHAWIEYTIQGSNGSNCVVIRYDPLFDVYLEPLPKDANLLIPIIPKEPREALRIIEQHSPD